ncbi:DUF2497 domain-containing protein [Parasphingorhabdus sp.]|uniref:DUF2497 domain-containing protein n=1 Tax=Parasphingorhabdus sp. TaxID=2709688 RepID=UPI0032658063
MSQQNKESSMEEILSSIKRIIAEDKAIEMDRPATTEPRKDAVADQAEAPEEVTAADSEEIAGEEEILELTNEVTETTSSARGVFGDRRKKERLINDQKLDSMRQSLSALVAMEGANSPAPVEKVNGTSLEDLTREMMRPMLENWLNENLPQLVEELVAEEIRRISQK